MMSGDVVGQVTNGGFVPFVGNCKGDIPLAHDLIAKLGWDDLTQRFNRALIEQVKDPNKPVVWEPIHEIVKREYNGDVFELCGDLLNEDDCPPEEESDAFNTWFLAAATKAASVEHVGRYIRANRACVCLIVGG
jgi:hypothetical protein